jgi:hypothetical protein
MAPFEPIGPTARWKTVYEEVLIKKRRDQIATYEEIGEVLGLHPEDARHTIQMVVRRAAKELLLRNDTALEAINNVGYRLVMPDEHTGLARRQQRRSSRALQQGHQQVTHVDFTKMDPEARKAIETMANAFAMQMEFNRRLDVRQQNLKKALNSVVKRQDRTEEETRQRLEDLERKIRELGDN